MDGGGTEGFIEMKIWGIENWSEEKMQLVISLVDENGRFRDLQETPLLVSVGKEPFEAVQEESLKLPTVQGGRTSTEFRVVFPRSAGTLLFELIGPAQDLVHRLGWAFHKVADLGQNRILLNKHYFIPANETNPFFVSQKAIDELAKTMHAPISTFELFSGILKPNNSAVYIETTSRDKFPVLPNTRSVKVSTDLFSEWAMGTASIKEGDLLPQQEYGLVKLANQGTTQITLSPNGLLLGVAGKDGSLHLVDVFKLKVITRVIAHLGLVKELSFLDDQSLLSAGEDGILKIYAVRENSVLDPGKALSHGSPVIGVETFGDLIIAATESKGLYIWEKFKLKSKLPDLHASCLALSKDGKFAIIAIRNRPVILMIEASTGIIASEYRWDLGGMQILHIKQMDQCLRMNPLAITNAFQALLLVTCTDDTVKTILLPKSPSAAVKLLNSCPSSVTISSISPDGRYLATGNSQGELLVYELDTETELEILVKLSFPGGISQTLFSLTHRILVVASGNGNAPISICTGKKIQAKKRNSLAVSRSFAGFPSEIDKIKEEVRQSIFGELMV